MKLSTDHWPRWLLYVLITLTIVLMVGLMWSLPPQLEELHLPFGLSQGAFQLPIEAIVLIAYTLGAFLVWSLALLRFKSSSDQVHKARRKSDTAKVEAELSQDKIKALQSKISTLERALEQTLKKLNQSP